jgi:hypothetical protein
VLRARREFSRPKKRVRFIQRTFASRQVCVSGWENAKVRHAFEPSTGDGDHAVVATADEG